VTKLLTPDQTMFESRVCTRCGGTGEYSYNQRDGRTCYGCGGQGVQLTKRGAVALAFFRSSMERTIAELKIGDVVKYTGMTGGGNMYSAWAPVVEIDLTERVTSWTIRNGEKIPNPTVNFTTDHSKLGRCSHGIAVGATIQIKGTPEERATAIAAAREYQASLTKTGQPRKERSK
jgi:hypothetical protein